MPKRDPQIDAHLEWIGFVRPTGLVVSSSARAGAVLPRNPEGQRRLRACVAERRFRPDGEPEPWLPDFRAFAASVLGWRFSPKGYAGTAGSPIPPELETPLHEGGEVLRPDFAVRERDPRDGGPRWQLLVKVIEPDGDFDRVAGGAGRLEVSAHSLYELLRGVQAADDAWDRGLLRGALAGRPDDVYHALLTVILRLVFLLYAEERDLLPGGETFARHYSLAASTSACAKTRPCTPTRWTSATARGRSSWCCSGCSTTGPRPTGCGCRGASGRSSTPAGSRSSKAAGPARRARGTSGSSRRRCPTAPSTGPSTSCWCWTASASPTVPWTSSRSAPSTRR